MTAGSMPTFLPLSADRFAALAFASAREFFEAIDFAIQTTFFGTPSLGRRLQFLFDLFLLPLQLLQLCFKLRFVHPGDYSKATPV